MVVKQKAVTRSIIYNTAKVDGSRPWSVVMAMASGDEFEANEKLMDYIL